MNPQRKLSDGLDEILPSGLSVRQAIERQWGRVRPDPRRTKRGIPVSDEEVLAQILAEADLTALDEAAAAFVALHR